MVRSADGGGAGRRGQGNAGGVCPLAVVFAAGAFGAGAGAFADARGGADVHSVLSLCRSAGNVRVACKFAAGCSTGVQRAVAAVADELAAGVCTDKRAERSKAIFANQEHPSNGRFDDGL